MRVCVPHTLCQRSLLFAVGTSIQSAHRVCMSLLLLVGASRKGCSPTNTTRSPREGLWWPWYDGMCACLSSCCLQCLQPIFQCVWMDPWVLLSGRLSRLSLPYNRSFFGSARPSNSVYPCLTLSIICLIESFFA